LAGVARRMAGCAAWGWPTGRGGGLRVAALCGMGGAGKTSVAVEYAQRHLSELGLIWQLPAEDPTAMAAAFGGGPSCSGRRMWGTRARRWWRCTRC
jgi:hypothetical protein